MKLTTTTGLRGTVIGYIETDQDIDGTTRGYAAVRHDSGMYSTHCLFTSPSGEVQAYWGHYEIGNAVDAMANLRFRANPGEKTVA